MASFKGGFAFNNEAAKVEVEQAPDGTLISCVNPVTGESLGGGGGGGSVTIKLTNPVSPSGFNKCEIKEVNEDGTPGAVIGTITSATGSITLDCPAKIFIDCYGSMVSLPTMTTKYTCTGFVGVTKVTVSTGAYVVVSGDGEITISGIEWND